MCGSDFTFLQGAYGFNRPEAQCALRKVLQKKRRAASITRAIRPAKLSASSRGYIIAAKPMSSNPFAKTSELQSVQLKI
jgi:hypothetical protein